MKTKKEEYCLLEESGLFDSNWYNKKYPDVNLSGLDAAKHFLKYGLLLKRKPNSNFNMDRFLSSLGNKGIYLTKNPLAILNQMSEWSKGQEKDKILCVNDQDKSKNDRNPILNVEASRAESDYVLASNSVFFNPHWYLIEYQDVAKAGVDPLVHYLKSGWKEGRDPSPYFSTKGYLESNGDVANKGLNPLVHFLKYGKRDGRVGHEKKEVRQNRKKYFDHSAAADVIKKLKNSIDRKQIDISEIVVSIVMPTHNRKEMVCTAIDSALAQTHKKIEIIIVDDGSEDGTFEYLSAKYQDCRIKIYRIPPSGVCVARNAALKASSGEYVAYLDSDNYFLPDYIENGLMAIVSGQHRCIYMAMKCINSGVEYYRASDFDWEDLVAGNYIDMNVFIHHRSLYELRGGFDESLRRMVDWELIIRYTHNSNVGYYPTIGAVYEDSERTDRITKTEGDYWKFVIQNRYLINWDNLRDKALGKRQDIISIVIPVYNNADLTEDCLSSLFSVRAGVSFEVVIVDNGSDSETKRVISKWERVNDLVTVVRNPENLNFALGCNIGFRESRGDIVVFLNNDTTLTEDWLAYLVEPLKQHNIVAVQPKLLYPDNTIQCIGIVFSDKSTLGFPIYAGENSNSPHTRVSRPYKAVTAACMAVRSADFAAVNGFDPSFINGQEDVDLCLRLSSKNKVCWCATESVVIHHESKTVGRGKYIAQNRKLFIDRWLGHIEPDADIFYSEDGLCVTEWAPDSDTNVKNGLAIYRPVSLKAKDKKRSGLDTKIFAIKVPCPRFNVRREWGDYHFAVSLGAALARRGYRYRIDFLDQWDGAYSDDVNIVLRGLSRYERLETASQNIMWMISHPTKITFSEIEQFDHVFVSSTEYVCKLRGEGLSNVSTLLQCTDKYRFRPINGVNNFPKKPLFIGNSRNIYRNVVRHAIELGVDFDLYGTRWEQFVSEDYIRGHNVPNFELASKYHFASCILNDHWEDMRELGFCSNRIFDALACGRAVVSDKIDGIPAELLRGIKMFTGESDFVEKVNEAERVEVNQLGEISKLIMKYHTFDSRVDEILNVLELG